MLLQITDTNFIPTYMHACTHKHRCTLTLPYTSHQNYFTYKGTVELLSTEQTTLPQMTLLELTSGERSEQGMWTRSMVVPRGEVYVPLPYGPRSLSFSEFSKPSSFLGFNLPCARLDKQTCLLFSNLIILLDHMYAWTGILIPSTCVKLIQWTSLVKTAVTHKRIICSVEFCFDFADKLLGKSKGCYLSFGTYFPVSTSTFANMQLCPQKR